MFPNAVCNRTDHSIIRWWLKEDDLVQWTRTRTEHPYGTVTSNISLYFDSEMWTNWLVVSEEALGMD